MTAPERRHELHKTVVVLMGVAGSGKSTIAQLLAQQLGWTSIEGDDLRPPQNVAKMAAGTPLSDAEREPWLREISQRINQTEGNQVITCSALRRSYRDILRTADARARFLPPQRRAETSWALGWAAVPITSCHRDEAKCRRWLARIGNKWCDRVRPRLNGNTPPQRQKELQCCDLKTPVPGSGRA
jgi:hypothetical protein